MIFISANKPKVVSLNGVLFDFGILILPADIIFSWMFTEKWKTTFSYLLNSRMHVQRHKVKKRQQYHVSENDLHVLNCLDLGKFFEEGGEI